MRYKRKKTHSIQLHQSLSKSKLVQSGEDSLILQQQLEMKFET